MLKRLSIFVLILILIKPSYDATIFILEKVLSYVSNEIAEDILEDGSANESTSEIVTSKENVKLPKRVESVGELADAIYYYFNKWETEFEIKYYGDTSKIDFIIEQALDEASNRDQYILGHLANQTIEYEYTRYYAKIKIEQEYLTDATQEEYVNNRVERILENLDPQSMSDFEKVKFVNDYIVKNTEYSSDTSISPHSACAVLKENKGVCQGYTLLALKMLRELGIETLYVVGEVNSEPHSWNLVKVDGEWYHLDTTWNDPVPDRGNFISYQYFLLDDSSMKSDHYWNQAQYPNATSKNYAFMAQIEHPYEKDGYIYYSNIQDDNRLYRINITTGENVRLTDSRAQYIVGDGDWLYFSNYSYGAYLAKIRTDGEYETIIHWEEVSDLFIEDGYLNFSTNAGMKKIEI